MKLKAKEAIGSLFAGILAMVAARHSFISGEMLLGWIKALTAVLACAFGAILTWEQYREGTSISLRNPSNSNPEK